MSSEIRACHACFFDEQEVAQTNSIEQLEKVGFFGDESNTLTAPPADGTASNYETPAAARRAGFNTQIRLLFGRELKKLFRDKFGFVVKVVSNGAFGLLFGLIFMDVGRSSYAVSPEINAAFGAMANLLISTMFGVAQSSLMEFPQDRPVFLREYSTNHYAVLPYFVAKFTLECFTVLLQVRVEHRPCARDRILMYLLHALHLALTLFEHLFDVRAGRRSADRGLFPDGVQAELLLLLGSEFHAGHCQHEHRHLHRELRRESRRRRRAHAGPDRAPVAVFRIFHSGQFDSGVFEMGTIPVLVDVRHPTGLSLRVRRQLRDGGVRESAEEQWRLPAGLLLVLDHPLGHRRRLSHHFRGNSQEQSQILKGPVQRLQLDGHLKEALRPGERQDETLWNR